MEPTMEPTRPTTKSVLRPNRSASGPTKGARAPIAIMMAANIQSVSDDTFRSRAVVVLRVRWRRGTIWLPVKAKGKPNTVMMNPTEH